MYKEEINNLKNLDILQKLWLLGEYNEKEYYKLEIKYNVVFDSIKNNNNILEEIEDNYNFEIPIKEGYNKRVLKEEAREETEEILYLIKDLKEVNNNNHMPKRIKVMIKSDILEAIETKLNDLVLTTTQKERILNQKMNKKELEEIIYKSLLI